MKTFLRCVLPAAALLALAPPALAQTASPTSTDLAARRELLRRAQEAANVGHHAEALDLAQRAASINMTTSVRMFLGQEHRALGQLAEAMGDADTCVHEAERDPNLAQRSAILSSCRALVAELAPRIGRLTVHVDPPVEGLHVRVGTAELNPAFYGLPYFVTPGAVVVEATAPGREPFRATVDVAPGATGDMTVAMNSRTTAPPPTDQPTEIARSTAPPGPNAPRRITLTQRGGHGPPVPAIIGMGAGVVSLGASLLFFVLRNSAEGTYEHQQCTTVDGVWHCFGDQPALQQLSGVRTLNTVTDVTLVAGAGLAVAGIAWWAIDGALHRSESRPPVASLQVVPTAGGIVLGFGGAL